ncbi:MAG: 50S ribosomal protein L31 [Candidatus Uhrbacteria bacterium]|nr:50S ribosomal protein L31 [Candidatus Uhrbacteria bacterium]
MKQAIHPQYFKDAVVNCVCGQSFKAGSTAESSSVELCSQCHPFYTGKQKIVDTARRVEKFQTRVSKKADAVMDSEAKAKRKIERAQKKIEKKAKADNS